VRLALRAVLIVAAVGTLLAAPQLVPAPAPQPLVTGIGWQLDRTAALVAELAYGVDAVPVPVPVPGTPSCSRPGCR